MKIDIFYLFVFKKYALPDRTYTFHYFIISAKMNYLNDGLMTFISCLDRLLFILGFGLILVFWDNFSSRL